MRRSFLFSAFGMILALACILPGTLKANIEIQVEGDTVLLCRFTALDISVTGGSDYVWSPGTAFSDSTSATPSLTLGASQWIYVTGVDQDTMLSTDSVFVRVIDPTFEIFPEITDTICPGDAVQVFLSSNEEIVSLIWSPETGVSDLTSLTPTLSPPSTTTYSVTAQIGNCTLEQDVTVPVFPFSFERTVPAEDTVFLCLGDSAFIQVLVGPAEATLSWESEDTTINFQGGPGAAWVKPGVSTSYTITGTFRACSESTTVFVRVDSLPDLTLNVTPEKDPYCAGEEVSIFSQFASNLFFPDIEYEWNPMDGQIQDSFNTQNVGIVTRDTTTFTRITTNNACVDTSEITLNVIPPTVPLSVNDTTLCPGDQFQVEVLDPTVEDIMWMPEEGLSCTDCPDPVVTVGPGPVTYTMEGEKEMCPVSASLNVRLFPTFEIPVTPPFAGVCPGDEVQFSIDTTGLINLQLEILNGSLSCDNCPDPIVTVTENTVLNITAETRSDQFCGARGSASIVINPDQSVNLDPVSVCPGQPRTIDLTGIGVENPSLSISSGSLSCTDCLNPVVTTNAPGTITITGDAVNPNFCGYLASLPVIIGGTESITLPSMIICPETPTTINLATLGNFQNPSINISDGTVSCDDCLNPQVTIAGPSVLTVTADSENPDFCGIEATMALDVFPPDGATITSDPNPDTPPGIAEGDEATLTFDVLPPLPDGTPITWTINGMSVPESAPEIIVQLNEENNLITATFINSNGCEQTATIEIMTRPPERPKIPNTFTPNGDMVNDIFKAVIEGNYEVDEFLIFNRWGQKVFEGNNNDGWDGTFEGEPAPTDVYVYLIKFREPDGETLTEKGDITLLR